MLRSSESGPVSRELVERNNVFKKQDEIVRVGISTTIPVRNSLKLHSRAVKDPNHPKTRAA